MTIKDWHKGVWYWLCKYIFVLIPATLFYRLVFFVNCRRLGFKWYWFNLKNPETFNEKINYLKLNDRNPLSPVVADKVSVRDYIIETIGEKYLVPLIGIYTDASDIDFEALPNQFALKTNHGSGWNLICKDKNGLNWETEKVRLNSWLKRSAYYLNREWQYKGVHPQLICEQMLEYEIKDFKLFCFNGSPKYIQVDVDRFTDSGHRRSLLTKDWIDTDIQLNYPKCATTPERPVHLAEMLSISKKLSAPFGFCRIDLYEHNNQIYFGEITIYPGGGVEPFLNKEQDIEIGKSIDLDFLNSRKPKS